MGNNIIRLFLSPVSWFYGMVILLRNRLFDWRILPSESFRVPVISVGNLTVGGTGKTPHIEYLIRLLGNRLRIAVLSRGYGRRGGGFVIAGDKSNSRILGDEPYLIYRKYPEVTVAVDANRRRGIRRLLSLPESIRPEVILLDDAFQHRYVKPSLSILLIDINRPLHLDSLLPAGRLREPARNANRADIVIITKCDESTTVHEGKFYTTLNYGRLTPLLPCPAAVKIEDLEMISREDFAILLITGIANPSLLIKYLNQFTGNLQTLTYPDHHRFTKRDFLQMERRFGAIRHKGIVVTTEKDAARLINHPQLPAWLAQYIYVLPVEVKFLSEEQEQLFIYKIEQHVRQNQGNGILAAPSNPRRD